MKKLYKKGQVHPSPPPPPPQPPTTDPLALLPATILVLAAALSAQDKEVLAYLVSYTNNNNNNNINNNSPPANTHSTSKPTQNSKPIYKVDGGSHDSHHHRPTFQCDCFRCYTSFWARWDASPNRQLIHEIIEAYEEKLAEKKKKMRNSKVKKERKKKGSVQIGQNGPNAQIGGSGELGQVEEEEVISTPQLVAVEGCGGVEVEVGTVEKGSIRRLVSFIGDRIWGVWNRV